MILFIKSRLHCWGLRPDEPSKSCFLNFSVTITGNFRRFQYFNLDTSFLKKRKPFSKTGGPFFS